MNYDITKHTAPTMPTLGKRTECIKILLSKAPKIDKKPLVPILFSPPKAHFIASKFYHSNPIWKVFSPPNNHSHALSPLTRP